MLMTFREFTTQAKAKNFNLFTDSNVLQNLTLPHILENGGVEITFPVWMTAITSITHPEEILNKRYGGLICVYDDLDINEYRTAYVAFLEYVNESMYRYYDLFTQKNNPYHNVDENTLVTDTFGKVVTTHDFEAQKTKTTLDERVNEMQFDQDTVTTDDGVYGQNADVLKATNHSNVMTSEKTDTTTTNKGGSVDFVESDPYKNTDTVEEYVNTHKVERGGNIGVTTNKTLAFEQMEYASAMKLYDMFLKEYMKFFSIGVWSYE